MTWMLLLALSVITVASRVLAMTLLPTPNGRVAETLDALPAPLCAGLAALALVGEGVTPPPPVLAAAIAALLGATRKSLLLTVAILAAAALTTRPVRPIRYLVGTELGLPPAPSR